MNRETFFYLAPYLVSILISTVLGIYAWRKRKIPGATGFVITMLGQVIWIGGVFLTVISPTLEIKLFWNDWTYLGTFMVPFGHLAFALQYTRHQLYHPRRTWTLLTIIPVFFLLLYYTDSLPGLARAYVELAPDGPFSTLSFRFGILAWIGALYCYMISLAAMGIIVDGSLRQHRVFTVQASIIVIASVIPMLGTLFTLVGVVSGPRRDITEYTFVIGNLIWAFALFRLRLLDLVPIARQAIVENMDNGIMVLDRSGRILDLNATALTMIGVNATQAIGQPAYRMLSKWSDKVKEFWDVTSARTEIVLSVAGTPHWYDLEISPLRDQHKYLFGRLVVARDITRHKQDEEALRQARDELESRVRQRTAELETANAILRNEIAQRQKAEESLRESEERYHGLFESVPVGIYRSTPSGEFIDINQRCVEMLRYPDRETLLAVNAADLYVNPKDRDEWRAKLKQQGIVYDYELQFRRYDGTVMWAEDSVRLITNDKGQVLYYDGTIQDITERKRAEDALRESEERYHSLFEGVPVGIYRSTPSGRIIDVNQRVVEMLGFPNRETLLAVNARDLHMNPQDRDQWRTLLTRKGVVCDLSLQFRRYDGTAIWVRDSVQLTQDPKDQALYYDGTLQDITEHKLAEQALKESEQQFQLLAEAVPVGIFRTDRHGQTLYVNSCWCKISQLTFDQALGDGWLRAVHPDDRAPLAAVWERAVAERTSSQADYRFLRADGSIAWVIGHSIPQFDSSGEIVGYIGTITDITERKHAEDALRKSEERYRSISELITDYAFCADVDPKGGFSANWITEDSFKRMTGYAWDEIGNTFTLYHPDDAALAQQHVKETLLGQSTQHEYRIITKKGEVRWLSLWRKPQWSQSENRVVRFYGAAQDITERKHAEDALRKSEERYRTISDLITDYAYAYDVNPDGSFTTNWITEDSFKRMTGYAWDEIGNTFKLYHPDDAALAQEHVKETLSGQPTQNEYRFITKKGEVRWLYLRRRPEWSQSENRVVRFYGAAQDITERKLTEAALQASEIRYRALFENANDAIFLMNGDNFMECNPRALQIFGCTRDQIIGHPAYLFSPPTQPDGSSSKEKAVEKIQAALRGETQRFEWKHTRADRTPFDAEVSLTRIDVGSQTLLQAVVRDITARKKAERELHETKNYLDNILNSMPSILVGVDADGRVTHWNMQASRVTHVTSEQAYGQPLDRVLPQFATYLDELRAAIHDRQPRALEKVETHQAGEQRYSDVLVFPLVANGVVGAVIRVDDITERVHVEELMIQAEKMMSVGGLAAGMAHEINNPLGAILQGAQNIERRLSVDLPANVAAAKELDISIELMRRYLDKRGIFAFLTGIRESGERAARIVSNMLAFSRRSESQFQPTSLPELLDHTVELAANDYDLKKKYDFRHIQITRDYDPALPKVPILATEIEQVILNLLKNSAHAMFQWSKTKPPQITLRTRREGNWAVIIVTDNGCGMEEYTRKRVFEPFFTTKEVGVGTGLGLSVSYMIITNNHKGTIAVNSTPNEGTTFTIRLPLERVL